MTLVSFYHENSMVALLENSEGYGLHTGTFQKNLRSGVMNCAISPEYSSRFNCTNDDYDECKALNTSLEILAKLRSLSTT
jgi:hypothetical protein